MYFGSKGIRKIRITGGEPFVRKDLIHFLSALSKKSFLEKISITSNLTLIQPYLDELQKLGINDVNVSLDCLDADRFKEITRRDEFEEVEKTLYEMIDRGFNIKINCVAMAGVNERSDIASAKSCKGSVGFCQISGRNAVQWIRGLN